MTPHGTRAIRFDPIGDTIVLNDYPLFALQVCSIVITNSRGGGQGSSAMLSPSRNPFLGFKDIQNLEITGRRTINVMAVRKGVRHLLSTMMANLKTLRLPSCLILVMDPHRRYDFIYSLNLLRPYTEARGGAIWPGTEIEASTMECFRDIAESMWAEINFNPGEIEIVA